MMSDVKFPKHIAIIMDGNGRWAEKRFLPRIFGHRFGIESVRKIVSHASKIGISYLTLYAFSSENWSRPEEEVGFLMNLLRLYIRKETEFLNNKNVRIIFIGRRQGLASDLVEMMSVLEQETEKNTGLTLVLAVNYGAYNEIMDAFSCLMEDFKGQDMFSIKNLQQEFELRLNTKNIPHPDLLIRTAGEYRISNFLLWQIAYSEFYFTNILWPDFNEVSLDMAISEYQKRERRYGALANS